MLDALWRRAGRHAGSAICPRPASMATPAARGSTRPRRSRGRRAGARRRRIAAWLALGARVFRLPGIYGPGRSPLDRVRGGQGAPRRRCRARCSAASMSTTSPRRDRGVRRAGGRVQSRRRPARARRTRWSRFAARAARACRRRRSSRSTTLSPMARGFYAENRRVANGKAKRVLGWRAALSRLPRGPARAQRDRPARPPPAPRRRRERRPAIALEQRRQQHRDHRHDHARIGRLGRADRRGSRRNRAGRRAPRRTAPR